MSRRKQSTFEDLIDLASLLPPWLSLTLALLIYLILSAYTGSDIASIESSGRNAFISSSLYRTLAKFGQYMFPAALTLGALVSLFKSRKRHDLFTQIP